MNHNGKTRQCGTWKAVGKDAKGICDENVESRLCIWECAVWPDWEFVFWGGCCRHVRWTGRIWSRRTLSQQRICKFLEAHWAKVKYRIGPVTEWLWCQDGRGTLGCCGVIPTSYNFPFFCPASPRKNVLKSVCELKLAVRFYIGSWLDNEWFIGEKDGACDAWIMHRQTLWSKNGEITGGGAETGRKWMNPHNFHNSLSASTLGFIAWRGSQIELSLA